MKRTLPRTIEGQGGGTVFFWERNRGLCTGKWAGNELAVTLVSGAAEDSFAVKFSENSGPLTDVTGWELTF